jgi:hypothetical protein
VKHQASAVAALLGQETRELICPAQLGVTEPSCNIASGKRGDIEFGQADYACLHLLRTVMQHRIHNRHACRGVTQGFAFGDEGNYLQLVQLTIPAKN